jgi:23S rRNA (adenine2503-C2)-methyltransferase
MYDGSSPAAIAAFKAVLEEHGLRATVRLTRGRDIDAACGQLAAKGELSGSRQPAAQA